MANVYFAEIHWGTKEVMQTFVLGGNTPIGDTTLEADPTSVAAEEYVNSLWKRGNIYKAFARDGDYTGWAVDRVNPSGIGCTWDEANDVFIGIAPFPSWTLNTTTFKHEPPVAFPSITTYSQGGEDKEYQINWREDLGTWDGKKLSSDFDGTIYKWNATSSTWEAIV